MQIPAWQPYPPTKTKTGGWAGRLGCGSKKVKSLLQRRVLPHGAFRAALRLHPSLLGRMASTTLPTTQLNHSPTRHHLLPITHPPGHCELEMQKMSFSTRPLDPAETVMGSPLPELGPDMVNCASTVMGEDVHTWPSPGILGAVLENSPCFGRKFPGPCPGAVLWEFRYEPWNFRLGQAWHQQRDHVPHHAS